MLASALGAIIFGRVADILGRKRIYGYEVLILAAGAIASALAPTFTWLLAFRAILGIGIGGDYPVSATIMSEYSGKQNRGRMIGLVFAMQGAGLIVGPLIAAALLAAHIPAGITWRVLLALGAIPGLAVFYLRRKIHETPRFALASGATQEAKAAIAAATGEAVATPAVGDAVIRLPHGALDGFAILFRNPRLLKWLIGTSAAWALMDFCYYGNSISTPEILSLINRHGTELDNVLIQLAIFAVCALPGYILAILLMDRTGRRSIQTLGFGVMGLMFLLIGLVPAVTVTVVPFVLLFGVSYFFTQFGPNTTTFVYPAEIFPVEVRTTGHGISAAAGKLGAFIGAFLFPVFIAAPMGIRGARDRGHRGHHRHGGHRGAAARTQGQEPGGVGRRSARARTPRGHMGGSGMSYRIVVGIDASTHSAAALRWAVRHAAGRQDAVVITVLAWQMPLVSNPAAFDREALQRTYEKLLAETVSEALPSPGLPVGRCAVLGDPIDVLVEASRDAQLLVVGSRGRSPFAGVILGSVSQACAARAACPVVVVKEPNADGRETAGALPHARATTRIAPAHSSLATPESNDLEALSPLTPPVGSQRDGTQPR
ncbi:MFS transporter [Mycobacterium sp. SM1]|uniref:MFS transporter n=1 Tax=Mycobacterium sp. SM1 TaxID=2816243 RepID=UPI001BD1374F|nr:MFS transporter [Mycobacterium sp. SM1]MBS4728303.1 MFS transporter [Mycobacterium sp. SM1]